MADLSQFMAARPLSNVSAQSARLSPSAAVDAFLDAMEAEGVHPMESIGQGLMRSDGDYIRFRCHGDKAGRRNGWAKLRLSPVARGAFGNWRLGIRTNWEDGQGVRSLTDAERAQIEREIQEAAERKAKREIEAMATAERLLLGANPADASHPYLVRKRIAPERLWQSGDVLLAPLQDLDGKLWNVQRIWADGTKRFLKGGRIERLFWLCGAVGDAIYIGEGIATMAAVKRALGVPVVAAMTAGNLPKVAQAIKARRPSVAIIVCGDDDEAGHKAAKAAAPYADFVVIGRRQGQ